MLTRSRGKRAIYLIHRWTGIAACLLMVAWFASGMVMLFVGYPKLTPWERLGHLPDLPAGPCWAPVERALAASADPAAVTEIMLTTVRGRPTLRLREGDGRYLAVDARTASPMPPADAGDAVESARAYLPGVGARYLGSVDEDRWTHSATLNPHRPLHKVQMNDPASTLLYVSSATGEVVLDAPRAQRLWNYAGAWLHWLYMFRDRPVDPGWSWLVISLSAMGTMVSVTGTAAGLWRWRFRGTYKSGARSPYRDAWLRWHHIAGLVFAGITFAWIFSGLMSMNPAGLFHPSGLRPDLAAYRGATPGQSRPTLDLTEVTAALWEQGFEPREIEWRVLGGRPYLLARDGAGHTRLVTGDAGAMRILGQWSPPQLKYAATRLLAAPIAAYRRLDDYDAYYYGREPEAMMGASERRLPVWRAQFADASKTWVYLDPYTGDPALSVDGRQRLGRWLFNFLHSWDLPPMLAAGVWREAVLILMSLGGLALSVTGTVIAYRRVRMAARRPGRGRTSLAAPPARYPPPQ
ncbi:MAG: PepSY domain-containing protein [Pigmentiphaga sp.]|uniref:PepSY domain-containing protein n=1 Tax=Pigmentiphaga sp. TaxID=1977564 RepID=UPI0029A5636F|nr:PepSY domain-containing protein [Pigmentiphaga sp.]MDX3904301.1 PepSY domain-containing protein [Pigmentiphaga sp.]